MWKIEMPLEANVDAAGESSLYANERSSKKYRDSLMGMSPGQ